ncbi:hypothetical protein HDU86_006926 [Geranomyces michiganensis]|nr:hypothetical protein HDU86_006926 [Geranomyces michiganensis]
MLSPRGTPSLDQGEQDFMHGFSNLAPSYLAAEFESNAWAETTTPVLEHIPFDIDFEINIKDEETMRRNLNTAPIVDRSTDGLTDLDQLAQDLDIEGYENEPVPSQETTAVPQENDWPESDLTAYNDLDELLGLGGPSPVSWEADELPADAFQSQNSVETKTEAEARLSDRQIHVHHHYYHYSLPRSSDNVRSLAEEVRRLQVEQQAQIRRQQILPKPQDSKKLTLHRGQPAFPARVFATPAQSARHRCPSRPQNQRAGQHTDALIAVVEQVLYGPRGKALTIMDAALEQLEAQLSGMGLQSQSRDQISERHQDNGLGRRGGPAVIMDVSEHDPDIETPRKIPRQL